MATSTDLEQAARSLFGVLADRTEAVDELVRLADGRRVSLVRARQHLSDGPTGDDAEPTKRAIAPIKDALQRGSWSE
jgi:hypothetical protein